jgi:hypothetical protein
VRHPRSLRRGADVCSTGRWIAGPRSSDEFIETVVDFIDHRTPVRYLRPMQIDRLIGGLDAFNARVSASQRGFLALLAEADERELWREEGARDMAHWVSMRYGISWWKADRWVRAAHQLERLPKVADALSSALLSIDKVVELTRFATPETEERLIRWADGVSAGAIRRRADVETKPKPEEAAEAERDRYLDWWWRDGGLRLVVEGELPPAEGAEVIAAIERWASRVPAVPGEEDVANAPARRADALVALCTKGLGAPEAGACIVVHVQADTATRSNGELEGGGVLHPRTIDRLLCAGRVQAVLEDENRNPRSVGRVSREPSAAMIRMLRYRDHECRFPIAAPAGSRRLTTSFGGPRVAAPTSRT